MLDPTLFAPIGMVGVLIIVSAVVLWPMLRKRRR